MCSIAQNSVSKLRAYFLLTLFWYTQHYPCTHTQGMTGYLPTSDKSRPRSILGARTRISGIVSISSAHTWSLQGRQSQTTHQHYPHQPSTTCTLSMQPGWNTVIQGSFMNVKALVHTFYLVWTKSDNHYPFSLMIPYHDGLVCSYFRNGICLHLHSKVPLKHWQTRIPECHAQKWRHKS